MTAYWTSLIGGMLIGISAVLLLLVNGRIAGISGIVGGLLGGRQVLANGAFLAGLLCGPLLHAAAFGRLPAVTVAACWSESGREWAPAAPPAMAFSGWRGSRRARSRRQ